MNIIVSFEGLSDVSVVLLQNTYGMMSPFTDVLRHVTLRSASLHITPPTNTKFAAVMVFRTTVDNLNTLLQ